MEINKYNIKIKNNLEISTGIYFVALTTQQQIEK